MMLGLVIVARPLINLLFSAKWIESVLFFQLMCAAGLLYPLQIINLEILKVKGRSDLFFQLTMIKRTLMMITILLTFRWGINAMLVGQIINSVIAYFINSYYSEKLIEYSVKAQLADIVPNLFFAICMAAGMWWFGSLLAMPDWAQLLTQTLCGLAVYFFLNFIARTEPLLEVFSVGRRFLAARIAA
jgi:O-antigen/teichoic acid export membrane protein